MAFSEDNLVCGNSNYPGKEEAISRFLLNLAMAYRAGKESSIALSAGTAGLTRKVVNS